VPFIDWHLDIASLGPIRFAASHVFEFAGTVGRAGWNGVGPASPSRYIDTTEVKQQMNNSSNICTKSNLWTRF